MHLLEKNSDRASVSVVDDAQKSIQEKVSSQMPPVESAAVETAETRIPPAGEVTFQTPTTDEYLGQVRADPEGKPVMLMVFSIQLSRVMTRAMKDRQIAQKVFNQLEDCALERNKPEIPAIQTSCYVNAARLFHTFPDDFRDRFESLDQQIPEKMKIFRNLIES